MCACVRACVCVSVCVRACVRVCMCVCVCKFRFDGKQKKRSFANIANMRFSSKSLDLKLVYQFRSVPFNSFLLSFFHSQTDL